MKKFFESIKDFIYDSVDYLIMITIIGIVVVVIGWRINILFEEKPLEDNEVSVGERENDDDYDEDIGEGENSDTLATGEIVTVTIPSGSLSSKIGDILVDQGLVSSREEFVAKSQEMNLDTKLKSGSFEIEAGTSLENIIKIIAK